MSPTIRIDNEIYMWLQKNAQPFEDTPNSVLRRIAGLDNPSSTTALNVNQKNIEKIGNKMQVGKRKHRGKLLNDKWGVGAEQALYHKDGHWYNNLEHFPGALFDPDGYILFKKEEDYRNCLSLKIGQETNVPNGIASIPGYIKKVL